jgi:hypothetical protein
MTATAANSTEMATKPAKSLVEIRSFMQGE